VPTHCLAVEALAVAMADAAQQRGLVVRRGLLQAGALLHDVGRSLVQDVRHASEGARLLREEGCDGRLVRIVERHTGGGIDAAEARALGLPAKDYTPRSLEERIVCHADNLYSGTHRLRMAELRGKYLAKGLPQAWARIEALHAALGDELGADLEALEPATLPAP
jgi:uncharacterized protein (TIGR00295 family)